MPINAHPEYLAAEKEYLLAQTPEEKITKLKKMISLAPGHKGAENLRAQLKTRLKKLIKQQDKAKKASSNAGAKGIKKDSMQAVIVGFANSGKSTLIKLLTNANPEIAAYKFTTKSSLVGMIPFSGTQIQLVEIPAVNSEYYDKGTVHTADTIIIIVNEISEIKEIEKKLDNKKAKRIILFNPKEKIDKRKIEATLKSKKYNFEVLNLNEKQNPEELKEKIFQSFGKIRVHTKEPGKPKSNKPIVLPPRSTVKDVAEKIFHGFSKQVSEIRLTGPSSKFPNQKVGLKHKLKDLDVVEFKTR